MPTVSVLYIADKIVGPHLELLRYICEPTSRSRPHVTVRYFAKLPVPKRHLSSAIASIDLVAPGAFGLDGVGTRGACTVFIRCTSDDLAHLEHKPHYPTSEFHVTLYDGVSQEFARKLLHVLKSMQWGYRVKLPRGTTLTRIPLRGRRPRRLASRAYSPTLRALFKDATAETLDWHWLTSLSNDLRLELVKGMCAHLRKCAGGLLIGDNGTKPIGTAGIVDPEGRDKPEVHLTPPELAVEIADYAVGVVEHDRHPIHFGDPAVGTGAFYSALLQVVPRERIASAIGVDISLEQVAAAQSRWQHRGMQVMLGDYLHMGDLPHRTLILANPPYLRHQGIPAKYKQELRERASINMKQRVSGRSGLYVYFMLLSHEWMEYDALAAWLIPSEFMQTEYGAVLRKYLTRKVELVRIHQFAQDVPQFENAKVLPAVVVFRNRRPMPDVDVVLSVGGSLKRPATTERIGVDVLRRTNKWHIPSREVQDEHEQGCIGDLFVVRRGIATGANGFFIMERRDARKRGLPAEALRPILPKARSLKTDIVTGGPDGYPQLDPQLCLLDSDLPEAEIERKYPRMAEYLKVGRSEGLLKRNLVGSRKPWYRQERREPPPFLCTYMGRRRADSPPVRFVWNSSDAIATNSYLLLYPRAALARMMKKPGVAQEVFSLLQQTARESMRDSWRVHGDGLHKIEPGDLIKVRFASTPGWLSEVMDRHLPLRQVSS